MRSALFVSDHYRQFSPPAPTPALDTFTTLSPQEYALPDPAEVASHELVAVLGTLEQAGQADEVAGLMAVALDAGRTVVLAYPQTLGATDLVIATRIARDVGVQGGYSSQLVAASVDTFDRYFKLYGRAGTFFSPPDEAEILGTVESGPAALALPRGRGVFYLLPFQVANVQVSHQALTRELLHAVLAHRAGEAAALPGFLADLRLPGEDEILDEIAARADELECLQERARELEHYRHLIGRLSGAPLERVVIEALNVVLEATEFRAEDRPDVFAEDFWIVGPAGDYALAEAKGIGSNVRRQDVNQVENQRAELDNGATLEELPGLLVVNTFRGDSSLDRRHSPVSDDVVRHAVRQNVLVLRGYDLYNLVGRALAGDRVGDEFLGHLAAGGGWLEVTPDTVALHRGKR